MTYRIFKDVVMDMVYGQKKYSVRSDKPLEVTYGMPFRDYMELVSELLSNHMIASPGPSTGFIIKQVRLPYGVVVNIIQSESFALRMGGLGEGDKHFGVNLPLAPVIQMQTLPHRA